MIHLGHEDADDRNMRDVEADRHAYLAGSTVVDDEGREWIQVDADDREEAKQFFRYRSRYTRQEPKE